MDRGGLTGTEADWRGWDGLGGTEADWGLGGGVTRGTGASQMWTGVTVLVRGTLRGQRCPGGNEDTGLRWDGWAWRLGCTGETED